MTIEVGSISHGTLLSADLAQKFIAALPGHQGPFGTAEGNAYQARFDALVAREDDAALEEMDELRAELETRLDQYAQEEGLTFGPLEGDSSDYGFWLPPCEYCGGSTEECADGICERALEREDAEQGVVS